MYFNAAGIYAECHALARNDRAATERDAVADTCRRRAIECLDECFEKSPERREFYLRQAELDQAFDSIRESPEFKEAIGGANR